MSKPLNENIQHVRIENEQDDLLVSLEPENEDLDLTNSSAPAEVALLEANSSTGFVDAVTRTDVSGFLAELYFKSRSGVDSKFSLLSFLFDRIEGAFFNRDLQRVEALLDEFDPTRTLDIVSVSVLRSTFRAKNRLKSWDGCLARVIKHLNDSGKDWKRQLRGLVGSHDTFVRTSYFGRSTKTPCLMGCLTPVIITASPAEPAPSIHDDPLQDITYGTDCDPIYPDAIRSVVDSRRASISHLQRHLQIGYNRAARLLESMEKDGYVTPMNSSGSRDVTPLGLEQAA